MKIDEFAIEVWMNAYETKCAFNLAETCVDSVTIAELLALSGQSDLMGVLAPMKMTYGAIEGSERLRQAIGALYRGRTADEVVVTHGAIGANALLYETLIEPGDEIVSIVPTYQQHYSIPEALGANVKRLKLRMEDAYLPDLDRLADLITPNTRLVSLCNPNNPCGSVIGGDLLQSIAELAARHGAWVLSDEVYRGINQHDDELGPSIAEIYDRGISVGSMSKAFALAGLRLGWIVAPKPLLHQVMIHRDYNTISVGQIDDFLASIALENRGALLARNRSIVRTNFGLLSDWMKRQPSMRWVKPRGGTVTLLSYDEDIASADFCKQLLAETGVLLSPGSAFDMDRTVRIGFGNGTQSISAGLARISDFLDKRN